MLVLIEGDGIGIQRSSVADVRMHASYVDKAADGSITANRANAVASTIGITGLVDSPPSGSERTVEYISVYNADDTDPVDVTIIHSDGVASIPLRKKTLQPGEFLSFAGNEQGDKGDTGTAGAPGAAGATGPAGPSQNFRGPIPILSNNAGTPATHIDIAAGQKVDDTNGVLMNLLAMTKNVSAAWAVGTGNGALDTGSYVDGTLFVFHIERPDTLLSEVLVSYSPTAPTMPASYTRKKRIGALVIVSGVIKQFIQTNNKFTWKVPHGLGEQTIASTAAILVTLPVPVGITVDAIVNGYMLRNSGSPWGLVTSPGQTDTAPAIGAFDVLGGASFILMPFGKIVRTDTSGRLRYRQDTASQTWNFVCQGYYDDIL